MAAVHSWSSEETGAFISFMEEMVVEGHRVDGGHFKAGTFQTLAQKMNEKFPECGLASKHVKNKHKRLKEKYQTAADMLNCSGFGWNDEKQCVEVDSKEVLEIWMKKNPNKFYTPGKPFPLFSRLEFIFGKDRANGNLAESAADAAEEMDMHGEEDVNLANSPAPPPPTPYTATNVGSVSMASSSSRAAGRILPEKRKGKDVEVIESLVDIYNKGMEQHARDVQVLARAISGAREDVAVGEVLKDMGLGVSECVQVMLKFSENPQYLKAFWGCIDEQRLPFVMELIK